MNHMDKKILRLVLESLQPDQVVSVHLRGSPPEDYRVVNVKTGRGKHGSFIATLQAFTPSADNPSAPFRSLTIGTAKNLEVLSISVNGERHGVASERDEEPIYEVNTAMAANLKAGLLPLVGLRPDDQKIVRFESANPAFNGRFIVRSANLAKGKYGQVHLSLFPEESNQLPIEFWSHRHSGLIQNFEVL